MSRITRRIASATSLARRALPEDRYQQLRRGYRAACLTNLNDELMLSRGAHPAPLAAAFKLAATIPGYFTYDDAVAFTTLLSAQSAYAMRGDLFEIGSYQGRSAVFLARCLNPGEVLVICDAFEAPAEDKYPFPPSPAQLLRNLTMVVPDLHTESVEILADLSTNISFDADRRFRFAHVDGGHSFATALSDLRLCASHMLPGGIIAVDDYEHESWPEVTKAVDAFRAESTHVTVMLDLSRQGAIGRKLYLQVGTAGQESNE